MAVTISSLPSPIPPAPQAPVSSRNLSTGTQSSKGLFSDGSPAGQKFSTDAHAGAATDTSALTEDTPKVDSSAQDGFARKERQIRRMQQELQQQKQDLEAKRTSYETDYVPKDRLKSNFWDVAEELGLDYDQLTQQMLSQPNDPATRALMNKVRAMEEKQSTQERAQAESQKQAYEGAKKQISTQIEALVSSSEEFEFIKTAGLQDEVLARIEQEFHDSGQTKVMDVKEACTLIENEALEDMLRLVQLKKVQGRLKPQTPSEPEQSASAPVATAPKTISNSMGAQPATKLTSKERMERAMAAFNGTLK